MFKCCHGSSIISSFALKCKSDFVFSYFANNKQPQRWVWLIWVPSMLPSWDLAPCVTKSGEQRRINRIFRTIWAPSLLCLLSHLFCCCITSVCRHPQWNHHQLQRAEGVPGKSERTSAVTCALTKELPSSVMFTPSSHHQALGETWQ